MVQTKKTTRGVVNTREAAEFLGVISEKTLKRWRRLRPYKGPKFVDLGGRIGYRISDLEEYLESNLVTVEEDDFVA